MLWKAKTRCTDPEIAQLVHDAASGVLTRNASDNERRRFLDHIKSCEKCRAAMLEQAHETVTVPTLERIAREKNVSFEDFAREFAQVARQMMQEGRFKELGQRYRTEVARTPDDDDGPACGSLVAK